MNINESTVDVNTNTNPSPNNLFPSDLPYDITPNPIKGGVESSLPPAVKDAKEGYYYKNKKTGQIYVFEGGKYSQVGVDESGALN